MNSSSPWYRGGIASRWFITAVMFTLAFGVWAQADENAEPDPVVTLAERIADTGGRLLSGVPSLLPGTDTLTVVVGDITYDGVEPAVSTLLRPMLEDELLATAERLSRVRPMVVNTRGPADLEVAIAGSGGAAQGVVLVRILADDGRLLASSRLPVNRGPEVASALSPRPASLPGGTDGDDVPDVAEQARTVDLDSVGAGLSLNRDGDWDWFTVSIPDVPAVGDDGLPGLRVYTTGTTDTYLEIYGPSSPTELLTQNDDNDGTNAGVSFPVAAGDQYWIKVRGFADSSTGAYDLHVETEILVLDAGEPNSDMVSATYIDLSTGMFPASIRPSGDHDWYRLDVTSVLESESRAVSQEAQMVPALAVETTSTLDTVITVYDAQGTEIGYNDDGGNGSNARVLIPAGSGEVFVEVRGYGNWVEGDYTLTWDVAELIQDQWEPDNTREDAPAMELDSGRRAYRFSSAGDVDWVRLEIAADRFPGGTPVSLETFGDIDTYLVLYNQEGEQLASSDDDGSAYNARIDIDLTPGVYFIEVSPLYLDGPNGQYELEARIP